MKNRTGIAGRPPKRTIAAHLGRIPRLPLLLLCLLAAAGGAWAFFEFVVWNRLPPALVGKWVVIEGEQEGATFDFHRSGVMVGRINMGGQEGVIRADVTVEDKNVLISTRNPKSGNLETRVQTIKLLTTQQLILEDDHGNTFKMERAN